MAPLSEHVLSRFYEALPAVRKWIETTIAAHAHEAVPVASLGFERLRRYYPEDLLERTCVVTVDRVRFPPLSQLGLPELSAIEDMNADGITFDSTLFVADGCRTESLCFHEMVHVVQWQHLGSDEFVLAYGLGLLLYGYDEMPLEKTAYRLQGAFDRDEAPADVVARVQTECTSYWKEVSRLLPRSR